MPEGDPAQRPLTPRRCDGTAAAVRAAAAFALGHKAGQERDARETRRWLELEG